MRAFPVAQNPLITQIELMASRAWPAREVETLGGWILRADHGVTRRANSVLPVGSLGDIPLDEAISHVRSFYEQRGITPCFQMTTSSEPAELDNRLGDRGFVRELVVNVQISDLRSIALAPPRIPVVLRNSATPSWIKTYADAEGYDTKSATIRRGIIGRIALTKALASATVGRRIIAVGLGVVENDWLGLFSIATLSEYRRQGAASSVVAALCSWGLSKGAKSAYLQVESRNQPALEMYEKTGFKSLYTYWHRMLRADT